MTDRFEHDMYVIRRKVLKIFGGAFHIYDPNGNVVLYSKMKAFKLKEDIRLYTGEDMKEELLTIRARKIIDFSSAYDIYDAKSDEKIGAMKRKGMKSLLKDEWIIMDPEDREIGLIKEDSAFWALFRRFGPLGNLIPQSYRVELDGREVAEFRQHFNPFVFRITLQFLDSQAMQLDRRLGLAGGLLLAAIEGRQQ